MNNTHQDALNSEGSESSESRQNNNKVKKALVEEGTKKTILIIDDDGIVRQALKTLLVNSEYKVLEAEDGEKGLDVLKKNPGIDVIVTDYEMPGIQGTELIAQIRQLKRALKIVMMTGCISMEKEAIEAGADAFVEKPDVEQLVRVLAELTGREAG